MVHTLGFLDGLDYTEKLCLKKKNLKINRTSLFYIYCFRPFSVHAYLTVWYGLVFYFPLESLAVNNYLYSCSDQMDNQIVVSDYAQMDRVLREERAYILNLVKQIKKTGCNVLLIQKSILRSGTIYFLIPEFIIDL